MDALAAAGGLGPTDGDLPDARVSDGNVVQNVSLQRLLHGGDLSQNVTLANGVTIYVPSPATFNIQVYGAVDHPGDVTLHEGDAFFIIPSAVAFLLLGDIIVAAIYQSGKFHRSDVELVWAVLAGSSVGLLATSLGRLYSSAFYALLNTKSPLRFAIIRVVLTAILGLVCALWLPNWLGLGQKWGVAGLTASAGVSGWIEFMLLRHALSLRIGKTPLAPTFTIRLWSVAISSAAIAYFIKLGVGVAHPKLLACLALPVYGLLYFTGTALLGVTESRNTITSVGRRLGINL